MPLVPVSMVLMPDPIRCTIWLAKRSGPIALAARNRVTTPTATATRCESRNFSHRLAWGQRILAPGSAGPAIADAADGLDVARGGRIVFDLPPKVGDVDVDDVIVVIVVSPDPLKELRAG